MYDLMLKSAKENFEVVIETLDNNELKFEIIESDTQKLTDWIFRNLEPKGLRFEFDKNSCFVYCAPRIKFNQFSN